MVDLGTGDALFTRRADLPLVPASNEKLFTTATALLTQGPDAVRETRVSAEPFAAGERPGDLFLVGGGDPTLGTADLATLADAIASRTGPGRVLGGVVGDESLLDRKRGSVDSGFKADLDLGGQLGALVVDHGATDARGPAHLAAARLQALLRARGLHFSHPARTGRAPATADELLASDASPPLSEIVRATNQPSDNFYAELLLKLLGAEEGTGGTTLAGAKVARATLAAIGVRPTIADGSGLSRQDRTTARQLVALLTTMRQGPTATAWLSSLTVAGRNGTLARRMRGTAAAGRCRGKTGTLRGVSALSGYCSTTGGREVVFSFLENGVGAGAKAVEDRMVAAIARYEG